MNQKSHFTTNGGVCYNMDLNDLLNLHNGLSHNALVDGTSRLANVLRTRRTTTFISALNTERAWGKKSHFAGRRMVQTSHTQIK